MNSIGGTAERDLNANLKFNYNEANNTPAVHSYLAVIKLSAHAKCKNKNITFNTYAHMSNKSVLMHAIQEEKKRTA